MTVLQSFVFNNISRLFRTDWSFGIVFCPCSLTTVQSFQGYVILVAVGHAQVLDASENVVLDEDRVNFEQLLVHTRLHLKEHVVKLACWGQLTLGVICYVCMFEWCVCRVHLARHTRDEHWWIFLCLSRSTAMRKLRSSLTWKTVYFVVDLKHGVSSTCSHFANNLQFMNMRTVLSVHLRPFLLNRG